MLFVDTLVSPLPKDCHVSFGPLAIETPFLSCPLVRLCRCRGWLLMAGNLARYPDGKLTSWMWRDSFFYPF